MTNQLTRVLVLCLLAGIQALAQSSPEATRRATLGDILIEATGMNTGSVAAAQVGPWMLGPDEEFVTVNLRVQNLAERVSCTVFTAHMEVSNGEDYMPETGKRERWPKAGGFSSKEQSEGVYTFKIKRGGEPVMLLLERAASLEANCRTQNRNPAVVLGSTHVGLALEGLPATNRVLRDGLGHYSAYLGNLVVGLTAVDAVRVLPDPAVKKGSFRALPGEHFVVVKLHIQNVGLSPNCIRFSGELRADFGERIEPRRVVQAWESALEGLAPGRAIDASIDFAVKDDAELNAMELIPRVGGLDSCRTRFDPPIPQAETRTAYIPLDTPKANQRSGQKAK